MSLIRKSVQELIRPAIAYEDELPPEEFEQLTDDIMEYINSSKLFRTLYLGVLGITYTLPLVKKRRLFSQLSPGEQEDFLNDLHESRFEAIRGVVTLVGTPIKMVYYNRVAEMERLGFDVVELKKEADLRTVTRDRKGSGGCSIK